MGEVEILNGIKGNNMVVGAKVLHTVEPSVTAWRLRTNKNGGFDRVEKLEIQDDLLQRPVKKNHGSGAWVVILDNREQKAREEKENKFWKWILSSRHWLPLPSDVCLDALKCFRRCLYVHWLLNLFDCFWVILRLIFSRFLFILDVIDSCWFVCLMQLQLLSPKEENSGNLTESLYR